MVLFYACAVADASRCNSSSGEVCPVKDHAMMQLGKATKESVKQQLEDRSQRVSLTQTLIAKDHQIARGYREFRRESANIAGSMGKGITAVVSAVQHFMTPGGVKKGLEALGSGVLEAVDGPIKEALDPPSYEEFKSKWNDFFQTVPASIGGIDAKIAKFQETGKGGVLMEAISDIFQALKDAVLGFLPENTGMEIIKLLDTLDEILRSMATSWSGFEKGQQAEAIKGLYTGLRAGLDASLPEELRNDATYKKIIGTLDGTMKSLTKHVADYMKRLSEATCCYKVSYRREKRRPQRCTGGFYNNGEGLCLPGNLLQQTQANRTQANQAEGTVSGKKPEGARSATCDPDGNFPHQESGQCYAKCNRGYGGDGDECELLCESTIKFPSGSGVLCGINAGAVQTAVMQMVTVTINNLINAAMLIKKMMDEGIDAESLKNTIDAFVDMGKPFVYPTCPKPKR